MEADVPLNWSSIRPEHVTSACEKLLADHARSPVRGIAVVFRGKAIPAKFVLRLAYQLANGLEPGAPLKFSSGEGTIQRLRKLGLDVSRTAIAKGEA